MAFQDVSPGASDIPPSPIITDIERSIPTTGDVSTEPPAPKVEKESPVPPFTSVPDMAESEAQPQMPEPTSAPCERYVTTSGFDLADERPNIMNITSKNPSSLTTVTVTVEEIPS